MSILTQADSGSQQQGAVPIGALPDNSAQLDTASLGLQIQQKILHNKQLDAAIAQTLPAALTPVATSGQASAKLPSGLAYNVVQPNQAPAQGHSDARNKGIASVVVGAANIVGRIAKHRQDEKQRVLAVDIERIMGAQDAISQAKSILASDPNNAEAKAMLQKNQQIITDVASDPKKQKQLEKAFDLNYMDPSKNDKPEHKALQMAQKSFAEKLEAATPTKMVPNAQAQAKLQALTAQRAANDAELNALAPIYNQQQRDAAAIDRVKMQQEGADARTQYQQEHADERAKGVREEAFARTKALLADAQLRAQTALTTAGMHESGANARTLATIAAREKIAEKLYGTKPEIAAKLDAQNAKMMEEVGTKAAQNIVNLEATRAQADPAQKDKYDKAIQGEEEAVRMAAEWKKAWLARTNAVQHGPELDPQKPADQKGESKDGSSKQPGSASSADSDDSTYRKTVEWLLGGNEDDDSSNDGTEPDSIH